MKTYEAALPGGMHMKHKVKALVEVEKTGFFGKKKKVMEKRDIWVDDKTYKDLKKKAKNKPYSVEEMMLYDELFDEW